MTREEYDQNNSWGLSAAIDLYECDPNTIRDVERIKQFVTELCDLIKVQRFGECQIVHFADHNEDVAGFSMVQLIETSLISAHFANKNNATYLDIFSCKYYDPNIASEFAQKFFEAKRYTLNTTLRKK